MSDFKVVGGLTSAIRHIDYTLEKDGNKETHGFDIEMCRDELQVKTTMSHLTVAELEIMLSELKKVKLSNKK